MIKNVFENLGRLEPFEIRNSSITLCLGAPSTFIYLEIMKYYHPEIIMPFHGNIIFAVLFLIAGVLPNLKNKFILQHYGWFVFASTMAFQHYLTYVTHLNDFSLDCLLVSYVFIFGSVLLLSNRILVLIYSASQALHLCYYVYSSNLDTIAESSILLSLFVIFVFSFLIMNGFIRYQKKLKSMNINLEEVVTKRTVDLENRAKELLEKNKDLEEFAYIVSHDLKRPLRNIYTLTDWLGDDEDGQFYGAAAESLLQIQQQVRQMDLLVEGILNYSLQTDIDEEGKEVNVHTLVKRIINKNTHENVTITLEKKLPRIIFSESKLTQVFQNLIQNAIKHTNKKQIEIYIDYKATKTTHTFFVKDNGPGIDKKYHKKIFELFQKLQADSKGEAIGVGLALVKKIIERNEGKIYVESTVGNGATFVFTIPKS